jgi:hypothetical protein
MAASALGADAMHSMLKMDATSVTSAGLTGAYYAVAQKLYRGDNNYLVNAAAAAANDFAVTQVFSAAQ